MQKSEYHKESNFRFKIDPFTTRDGSVVFMVKDGIWVGDNDLKNGHSAPTVFQAESMSQAHDFCDRVVSGEVFSEPHESAYEGWPELREKVQAEYEAREQRRKKGTGTWQ